MKTDTIERQVQGRDDLQKTIIFVKEGIISNVLTILFTFALCGLLIWLVTKHTDNALAKIVAPFFCLVWLVVGGYWSFQNILNPKSCLLATRGGKLVWILRSKESGPTEEKNIPLRLIDTLEFVLPEANKNVARNLAFAELFIIDAHRNRHHLPIELWPGVHREKIVSAIKTENPLVKVVERIDVKEDNV